MKKVIALTLVLLLIFTISGCKKDGEGKGIIVVQETELDKDLDELDKMDQDINTSDLDDLEKDLEMINW